MPGVEEKRQERERKRNQKQLQYEEDMKNKRPHVIGKHHDASKRAVDNLHEKFFNIYGRKCVECGEENIKFLTLDHINNDGFERGHHRCKEEYRKAVNSPDKNVYQVLCFNCNMRKNRERMMKKTSKYRKISENVHSRFFSMYGNKCACCGENDPLNLTMDHVKNNGKELRKKNGDGIAEYRVAIKYYDPETYQVLCWNCNLAKRINNGVCPHKEKVK